MRHLNKQLQQTWLMLCLVLFSVGAMAQTPQFFYTPPGTTVANNIPTGNATNKRQCVYYPSDFGSTSPGYITKLYIKISAAATATYTDLTIKLGTAPSSYLTFTSATQAWLATDTVFYSPSVLLSTNSGNWYEITLPTPYYYNNTSNLIFEVSQNGYTTSYSGFYASSLVTARSIYGSRTSATASTLNDRLWQIGFDLAPNKAANNASVSELVSPVNFCAGTKNVSVKLKNKGKNVINNVTIQWELDNIPQTPVSWTSPLDTVGGSLYRSDTVITLGTGILFSSPRTIKAWSEYPNSVVDTVTNDDTIFVTVAPALSGSYTIGGSTPDYANIGLAVNALNSYGVCGPVVFTVDPATAAYSGNLTFGNISGASATNTITINGNGRTITSASTTDPTVRFNGSSYIKLDSFVISNTSTAAGFAMHIGGGSHHLTIRNNSIEASTTSTSTACGALIVSGSITATTTAGNNAQYLTITNNKVIGGYYGFTLMGNTGYLDNYGHYIANNTIRDFYAYGMYLGNADTVTFINNDINRATRAAVTTLYGIYLNTSRNLKIQKNRLHDFGVASYSAYPFHIVNCVNAVGYETEISNNAIYKVGTTAIMYGFYSLTTAITGFNFYHNTVQHDVAAASASAIRGANFTVAVTNVTFKNNIISITGGGTGVKTGIYVTTASATFISNNNVIYVNTSASNNVGYWGAAQVSLANWQAASGQDINSVVVNPAFVDLANGRLEPTTIAARGIGVPLGYTSDIVGTQRSNTKPDPGAFESVKSYNDAGVTVSNSLLSCSSLQDVKVNLVNYGKNQLSSVTINWTSNGVTQIPYSVTFMVDTAESIAGNDTIITIGQIATSVGVNDTIVAWTSLPNGVADTTLYNDSVKFVMKPGFSGGSYTVGSGGTYSTITAATLAMANGVCGPILLELLPSYTSATETFPIVFPVSTNPANTFTVRPLSGATGLTITGSNATAIVDLNQASYVTIDGRPGGVGSSVELSIINTATAGATVRLINGASNNTLKYVTITGSNATAASGVVLFSNTTSTGNSNNLIDHCNVNGNSASVNCIYSLGAADPADNKNNTVTNSNIYDFFANVASTEISGITLAAGNSNWTIGTPGNGNNFYQTAARTATSVPALTNIGLFKAIYINSEAVGGCNIIGNRIGGNIPGIPGSVMIIGDTGTSVGHTLRLIDNNDSKTGVANLIMQNVISDISLYSTVSNALIPIHGRSGEVNTINNTIGSLTGTGSVYFKYNASSTNINMYGIRYEACSGAIANNNLGSLSADAKNAAGGVQLLAIYLTGTLPANLTITNNIVGGTTPHSIQSVAGALGNVNVMGICASAASAAQVVVASNTVQNLSNLNASAGTNNGVKGIYFTGASTVGSLITGNTVKNLYSVSANTGADQTSSVIGITMVTSSGPHVIAGNQVSGLISETGSAANTVHGILINGATTGVVSVESNQLSSITANTLNPATNISGITIGTAVVAKVKVWNNMVSLGTDTSGSPFTGANAITGITKTGPASIFYNTVLVSGTGVSAAVKNTFAYTATANVAGDSLLNNMFVNTRANAGSGGTHYAISLANATNLTTNSNLLYTTASPLGLFNSIPQMLLADWKTATTQDVLTVNTAVNFAGTNNLHLTGASNGDMLLKGVFLPFLTTDIDGQTRTVTPYIGADEASIPLPVKLTSFDAQRSGKDVWVNWTTVYEKNASHFVVEVSADGRTFSPVAKVLAKGNSTSVAAYTYTHADALALFNDASALYYRLTSVDRDGTYALSDIVRVNFEGDDNTTSIGVYPNPFTDFITLDMPVSKLVSVKLMDITGKLVAETSSFGTTPSLTGLNNLMNGIYMMQVQTKEGFRQYKLVKH